VYFFKNYSDYLAYFTIGAISQSILSVPPQLYLCYPTPISIVATGVEAQLKIAKHWFHLLSVIYFPNFIFQILFFGCIPTSHEARIHTRIWKLSYLYIPKDFQF